MMANTVPVSAVTTIALLLLLPLRPAHAVQSREPQLFGPGVISGPAADLSPAFVPDGQTVYFTRANAAQSTILESHRAGGSWSTPVVAPFSGQWRDLEPTMAPDGSYLVFASNRPATADGAALDAFYNGAAQPGRGGNLWRVDQTASGWSAPHRLPEIVNSNSSIFSPSVAANGALYFMQPTGPKSRFHLFRAPWNGATYGAPVAVPVVVADSVGDFDPAIAPDESFLLFSSTRIPAKSTSLFIAWATPGGWGPPRFLGDTISLPNSGNIEARLSPDHRTLYFSSTRVIPAPTPMDRGATDIGLARMAAWDNGQPNIWQVSLDPILADRGASLGVVAPAGVAPAAGRISETTLATSPGVIGPGVISTAAEEFKATISPGGRTLMYVVTERLFRHMTLVQSSWHGGRWQMPLVVPFSGIWRDGDPAFAPDGRMLYFISNRPMPGEPAGTPRPDFNIWRVARASNGGWGTPEPLGVAINSDTAEFAPSVTSSGELFFSRGDYMYRAAPDGPGFASPVRLPMAGGDPAISADGRILVFDADGPTAGDADLFVSCRTASGWTAPSRFAEPVNSSKEEGDPSITPDGRTLLFFSRRTPPSDRAPRPRRPGYAAIHTDALENLFNGSRNLFEVPLSGMACPDR